MNLTVDIKTYMVFALQNGFTIDESKDLGMAKYCRLKYSILNLEIWNDRNDFDAILNYDTFAFNFIHLANFITKKKNKYSFPDFESGDDFSRTKDFLIQLDNIIKYDLDNILDFLFNLTDEKLHLFEDFKTEMRLGKL